MSVLVVALAAAGVLAQTTSFAGSWTLVPDPNGPQGAGFGGLGDAATIEQTATTMTVTRSTQMGEFRSVYNLDGSESKNTLNFNGQGFDQLSTAVWEGATLVVTTRSDFDGNTFETTMKLTLDASGTLAVESTRPDFQGGGAPVTTKTTYKKG